MGTAVRADLTVTMALLKRGLVLHPGAEHAGAVRVVDIGLPVEAVEQERVSLSLLERGFAWGMTGRRDRASHKGDYGHVLVVAGSVGKAGAAAMCTFGALRSGAGLVTVATPFSVVPVVQQHVMEAMCLPAAESIDGTLGAGAEDEIVRQAATKTAVAIGPGLTTHPETEQAVKEMVRRISVPMVIDADGLNALAGSLDVLKQARAPVIVTPHPGEMARLAALSSADVQKDRIGVAEAFAKKHSVTVVLKGAGTVVAGPAGRTFINSTGNPGMATAGTGDILTGMIGGLLAQGYPATQAACLGVYLHGLAGDLAAKEKGEMGMIAGDVIEKIPEAIQATAEPHQ
jgi:NAD(P)H-hydrate epimerase